MIREARFPEERAAVVALLTELQEYIASVDPLGDVLSGSDFDGEAYLDHILSKMDYHGGTVLVAEEEGVLCGLIIGAPGELSEGERLDSREHRFGEIYELLVSAQVRGKGIGVQLLSAMEEIFREQGCRYVSLEVFAPNTNAHRFYLREGYVDRSFFVRKEL